MTKTELRRRVSTVLATATLVLPLAACGSDDAASELAADWESIQAAGRDEGQVVVYASVKLPDSLLKEFEEETGIRVQVVLGGGGPLAARLDKERESGAAGGDVSLFVNKVWYADNESDLLEPSGPAYEEQWAGSEWSEAEGRYVVADLAPTVILQNPDAVEAAGAEPIGAAPELLQPALEGKVGILPAEVGDGVVQWWAETAPALGGDAGIEQLATLDVRRYPDGAGLAQAVASGELAVAVGVPMASAAQLIESGAPLEVVAADPTVAGAHYVGVVDWAHHKNAAQVFRDWLLSPEGQVAFASGGEVYSPLPAAAFDGVERPDTMQETPANLVVADGVLTDAQRQWFVDVYQPALGE